MFLGADSSPWTLSCWSQLPAKVATCFRCVVQFRAPGLMSCAKGLEADIPASFTVAMDIPDKLEFPLDDGLLLI